MYQYTGVPMYQLENVQIGKFTKIMIHKCPDQRIYRDTNLFISEVHKLIETVLLFLFFFSSGGVDFLVEEVFWEMVVAGPAKFDVAA